VTSCLHAWLELGLNAAASSDPLLAIFAPMNSVAAAYTAMDPVELLMIVHNLRIDCCTDHQWLTKFLAGAFGAIA
jgi:hypothetical protein